MQLTIHQRALNHIKRYKYNMYKVGSFFYSRFSSRASVDIHFDQFSEMRNFQVELDTNVPFLGGRSNIHEGLLAAEKEFDVNGDPNLPKVKILH